MKNIFAIIFATLAGVSTSLEAFINGELGKNTTALVATFISLVVGTIFFFINICLTGNLKTLASFNDINPKLLKNTYINSSITNDSRIFYRFTYIQRSYAFI